MGLLCLVRTWLNDRLATIQGGLFEALFLRRSSPFFRLLAENVLFNLAFSGVQSSLQYLMTRLSHVWRTRLNRAIATNYFSHMAYYKLAFVDKRVENPEQVIVNDVQRLSEGLSEVALEVLKALLDGTYFTYRLAQETSWAWASASWIYVVCAVSVTRLLSPPFGTLEGIRQTLEGHFRRAFSNVTTNGEAIAAFGGDQREREIVESRFQALMSQIVCVTGVKFRFGIIEDFVVKYCASTVAMVVILGPFFSGRLRSDGSTHGNAQTLAKMRYVTSVIIHQLWAIGGFAVCLRKLMKITGYSRRVGSLLAVLDELKDQAQSAVGSSVVEGQQIIFKDVEVVTPAGQILVKNLNFELTPCQNLLITGPNGAGKSSIFRCLGSLWSITTGTITKPNSRGEGLFGDVFYLPQKPYNVVGNLRQQLTYPRTDGGELTDSVLRSLLERVELAYLLDQNSDVDTNWEEKLSLGETQRLAMARLFYHKPTYAILDECTSGVSTSMEEQLYKICSELRITCITISHRPALQQFHHVKLELDGKGGYSVDDLSKCSYATVARGVSDDTGSAVLVASQRLKQQRTIPSLPPPVVDDQPFLARLQHLLRLIQPSWQNASAGKLIALVGVVIARVALSDRIAHLNGDTVSYLLRRDLSGFKRLVGISLFQCVASAVLAPGLIYLTRSLACDWRQRLSAHLNAMFFKAKTYYKLCHVHHLAVDADQRLGEDLDMLCNELANTFPDVIKPIADISWFSFQTVVMLGWRNTGLLYLYMVAGLGLLRMITPDFGRLINRMQHLQGRFRFVHTRVRTHGESIAFFGGDSCEANIVQQHFEFMMAHAKVVARTKWRYGIIDDFVVKQLPHIVTWLLSYLYTARFAQRQSLYAEGGAKLGHDLRFVASAVSHTFIAFGELLQLYKRFLEISGYASRVLNMDALMQAVQNQELMGLESDSSSEHICFKELDVVTPSGKVLASRVSMTVPPGGNLLITGPNTSGKSSLFRMLGGLWPVRCGIIEKPGGRLACDQLKNVFLVPQRPYNVLGTLADMITYPIKDTTAPREDLVDLLRVVQLEYLADRKGGLLAEENWSDVLSLGEQQRIGMARLFYHKPKYAVIDQATDAVSVDVEEHLYDHARHLGITIITISQRPGLVGKHTQELKLLDGKGSWELWQLDPSA